MSEDYQAKFEQARKLYLETLTRAVHAEEERDRLLVALNEIGAVRGEELTAEGMCDRVWDLVRETLNPR